MPVKHIQLAPLGTLSRYRVEDLAARLSRRVAVPCRVAPPDLEPEAHALPGREQMDADALLRGLEAQAVPGSLLLGVTAHDLALPVFTFVFGLARDRGPAAVVSLARLDPAFYGLPANPELLARRAASEMLHELGHLAGLPHCADVACLMRFAGAVERVDLRGSSFCAACVARLPRWLRGAREGG